MKVKIGPYKNWFGPYQLAEKICFWAKKEKDEYGFEREPEWVHHFGTFLAEGSWPKKEDEETKFRFDRDDKHQTWLYKLMLWIDSKRKRKVDIHIDRWDTWSMDHTLAPIILPMLKQLRETKHGYPTGLDQEDLPANLRMEDYREKNYDQLDLFDHMISTHQPDEPTLGEVQWDYIMGEMIFAFEMLMDDNWEEKYTSGEWDTYMEVCERKEDGSPKLYQMKYGENHTYTRDEDAIRAIHDRMANGFRLFGKYYQSLWD